LALQANVALTPYLKLGGCGNDLLKNDTAWVESES